MIWVAVQMMKGIGSDGYITSWICNYEVPRVLLECYDEETLFNQGWWSSSSIKTVSNKMDT